MDTRSRSTKVLMFPWLAHGHISPFLHLAKSLSNKNFITYICSSQINLQSIKKYLTPKHSISIKLVDLKIPPTQHLPPHYHTTNGLPPHLMGPLKDALDRARPNFSTLKPDLLIYDFLQPWAPLEAAAAGIPAVLFFTCGAASFSLMLHRFLLSPVEYPFPEIYFTENEYSAFSPSIASDDDGNRVGNCIARSSGVILIKSIREMEGKYIDFLSSLTGKKFIPVGPLIQELADEPESVDIYRFVEWLDRKESRSTVFASDFLSENEMEEIAYGLETCNVNFIWVVRFPLSDNNGKLTVEERLPLGFVERVGERGWCLKGGPHCK